MEHNNFIEIHHNYPGGLPAYSRQTIQLIKSNDPRVVRVHTENILNQGDDAAAKSFADALRGNTQLRYLCFGCHTSEPERVDMILSALTETKVMKIEIWPMTSPNVRQEICLNHHATRIGKTINSIPFLIRLGLQRCSLGPSTAISLADNIARNKSVEHIDLSDNAIGDDGAIAFATALRTNKRLKELILDGNPLTTSGQMALRNSIYDDSSLDALENSNHVIQTFFNSNPRSIFGKSMLNDCFHSLAANLRCHSEKRAITKKIHRYMQKKYGVKLQYQSILGIQTGLMPYLLSLIARRCDVGTMYDIIRHMPHLTETGSSSDCNLKNELRSLKLH